MKKIFLLVLLALISVSASARKSYITVYVPYSDGSSNNATVASGGAYIYLTGDVPNDIAGFEYVDEPIHSPGHYWRTHYSCSNNDFKQYSTGEILNVLSEYGYEVEFVDNENKCFLLSKEVSSGQTISKGDVNEDSEVNIADVNEVISLILGMLRDNPKLLEQLGVEQPK